MRISNRTPTHLIRQNRLENEDRPKRFVGSDAHDAADPDAEETNASAKEGFWSAVLSLFGFGDQKETESTPDSGREEMATPERDSFRDDIRNGLKAMFHGGTLGSHGHRPVD